MTDATPPTLPSDEERTMLRDSVRGFLERHWPAADAVDAATDTARVAAVWQQLAEQGLTSLGTDPGEGGLREVLIVMEELGRAACPAPLQYAALLNLSGADAPPLAAMRDGGARIAFAFAQADGDAAAGLLQCDGAAVCGEVAFVEAAGSASHFALLLPGPALAFVEAGSAGLVIEATPAMGTQGMSRLRLDQVAATLVTLKPEAVADLVVISRLLHTGRAVGAATRAFEMAVEYAKERRQFGQPIGRFQAVQHKLANAYIALQGVQLTARSAAQQHDVQAPAWRLLAAAATVLAGTTLRTVSLETQHAFGAIGYSEEHEAPRHFKQVHLDVLRHGGARRARGELAAYYLDGPTERPARTMPEYDLGPAGNAFRGEVRAWLGEHWSGARKAAHEKRSFKEREYSREFALALGHTGWIGLAWPERFGGHGRGAFEQLAFIEEMERAEAPRAGAPVQAAMLQVHGSPGQQARYLPEILRGEAIYGMGYSEPDSGSDLASMRTRAVRDGDEWVINGQKIWTTTYWGEYMLLATRTDPHAKPAHAGLSMFIVPMNSPGITVKTSTTMYGGSFANIFYDNLRLPADAMVGEVNAGWKVLTGALATERGFIGGGIVMKVARSFELLCAHIRTTEVDGRPLRDDPLVRERIATLAAEIEAGRQMMMHCAAQVDGGETPPGDAAASKVYSGELMERFGEVALDILGMRAALSEGSPGAILRGRIEQQLRHSLMWVISIGTNEIQRSLIAQRGLGLPR